MAPPFPAWPKAKLLSFSRQIFQGPSFHGSDDSDPRSSTSWQPWPAKNTPWLVVQGQPCSLLHGIPLDTASAHPYLSFSARWPLPSALDAHVSTMLSLFLSSFDLASHQGCGWLVPGVFPTPHSPHSQSMSSPSPGALALLVEATVFPPIPSHPRCILLMSARDIQRWWMLYSPQTAAFLCRTGDKIMASCSKDDFLVSCWSCCPRTRKQVCSIHPPHTTVHRASCTCALSVHIRRHARVSSPP